MLLMTSAQDHLQKAQRIQKIWQKPVTQLSHMIKIRLQVQNVQYATPNQRQMCARACVWCVCVRAHARVCAYVCDAAEFQDTCSHNAFAYAADAESPALAFLSGPALLCSCAKLHKKFL